MTQFKSLGGNKAVEVGMRGERALSQRFSQPAQEAALELLLLCGWFAKEGTLHNALNSQGRLPVFLFSLPGDYKLHGKCCSFYLEGNALHLFYFLFV